MMRVYSGSARDAAVAKGGDAKINLSNMKPLHPISQPGHPALPRPTGNSMCLSQSLAVSEGKRRESHWA